MKYTRITFDNYADYPVGTKLMFNFGAYYPTAEGEVTGYKVMEATKHFPASVSLTAKYYDPTEEEWKDTTVSMFVDKGVGVYLLDEYMY